MPKIQTLRRAVLGAKLDPFDPSTRHRIALIAILAWIGLGADGLSSSCYGPEEAFVALGEHSDLALFLALATAATVFIIAASYNQVIDLFPSGGGGYKAATRLLGARAGLISGSALIVDYVLTIAISVASGADAMFSMLSPEAQGYKLTVEFSVIVLLIVLNLRGVKESIKVLAPIFLGFVVSHLLLIGYGIGVHAEGLDLLWPQSVQEAQRLSAESGWVFVIALFLRAYSIGGGTYTGIEAVSNNINMLAEPRVHTGHWTMFYMAVSLAAMAGGIILLYLLWDVSPQPGQTLNAVTFRAILDHYFHNPHVEDITLALVLAFEAGLLLVAANTGFLGGPAVLASMASDRWVPRQFRQLSSRMVTQNGILLMGGSALLILVATRGSVALLVVLYSINVFVTFTLTLAGLARHWWDERRFERRWLRKLLLSLLGLATTSFMLVVLVVEKFMLGAWMTILITGAVAGICMLVRRHYDEVKVMMARVDHAYSHKVDWAEDIEGPPLDTAGMTAVVLVGANRGAGMRTVEWILEMFPGRFRNFVFVAVGEVDRDSFEGEQQLIAMQTRLQNSLAYFLGYCASRGIAAEAVEGYSTDPLGELMSRLDSLYAQYPRQIVFANRLVFETENLFTQLLHNQLPIAVLRKLHSAGREMIIVPVKVPERLGPAQRMPLR